MSLRFFKPFFSVVSVLIATSCLAQEVVVQTDYSTPRYYDSSYPIGGYALDSEGESKQASDSITAKSAESAAGGNDGKCLATTLDTTKSTIPDITMWDYAGMAGGSALELKAAFEDADLSKYTISFDAKVAGTKTLSESKCFFQFIVADDAVAKDEDEHSDVVLGLARGEDDGTNTFAITNEYKTFSFNLKDDMVVATGAVEDLAKHEIKQISLMVQAQGSAADIGKDADNVLYLDNIKLTKKTK